MNELTAKKILNQVKESYNKISRDFSSSRQKTWQELNSLIGRVAPGEKVLDLGCGNGRLAEFLGAKTDYVGLDNSAALIEIAKKKHPDKKFLVFDGLNLPFAQATFDKVFLVAVLHHVPGKKTRQKFLRDIKKVLRPGGELILTVWSAKNYPRAKKYLWRQNLKKFFGLSDLDFNDVFLPWGSEQIPRYFHFFSLGALKKEVKKAGLEVKESGFLKREQKEYNIFIVAKATQIHQ